MISFYDGDKPIRSVLGRAGQRPLEDGRRQLRGFRIDYDFKPCELVTYFRSILFDCPVLVDVEQLQELDLGVGVQVLHDPLVDPVLKDHIELPWCCSFSTWQVRTVRVLDGGKLAADG